MDFESNLQILSVLSDTLTEPHALDDALTRITGMAGTIMGTEQTVLLFRDEERHKLIVRTCEGIDSTRVRVGHPLDVPERLAEIIWNVRSYHQINWVESGIEDIGFPILVGPLRVKGERIGVMITGKGRFENHTFDPIRRKLYKMLVSFASLAIENAKVYDYLRQQFAQRSQDLIEENRSTDGDPTERLMVSSLNNPNKVVRLLARSFYKELVRAGFAPGHITTAAAEILGCITHEEAVRD